MQELKLVKELAFGDHAKKSTVGWCRKTNSMLLDLH